MAIVKWSEDLSVNVREIDKQHQKLVSLINSLGDAMRERRAKEVVGSVIQELADYALTHFLTEEKYFDKYGYPDLVKHKNEHDAFVEKVSKFQKDFDAGRLALSINMLNFLKDWLINHIRGTDKKYSAFFNEKGLS
ncbi:MAG: bacteriohemerythrin [Desulfatitalea sp.]|nr:bacteriohemerythrin [Desulfatitalea sp.]NNK00648.1 bacteriohemerythrin [Desulfatitalea sp.]